MMKCTREDFTIRLNCTITQWLIKSFFKFNKEADWKAEMWYELFGKNPGPIRPSCLADWYLAPSSYFWEFHQR